MKYTFSGNVQYVICQCRNMAMIFFGCTPKRGKCGQNFFLISSSVLFENEIINLTAVRRLNIVKLRRYFKGFCTKIESAESRDYSQ